MVLSSGAARIFVRMGPVTDDIRVQSSVILHKDHFHDIPISGLLQQDMT